MESESSRSGPTVGKSWRIRPAINPEALSSLVKANYSPLLAQLLFNRGIDDPGKAKAFLSTEPLSHDPMLLPGMEVAVQRLKRALELGERVAIFGDFDVDGVTGTAILARALKELGSEVLAYIPHRVNEGHGLTTHAVHAFAQQKVDLLITVDCGVTSYEEIEAAARVGIDVIVSDHHLAPEGPPRACAVVDPKLDGSGYPFHDLSGAGLALKLAQALYRSLGRADSSWQPFLALAALGTIADVVPLLDENRVIVRQGLKELSRTNFPGLLALIRTAQVQARAIDTEAVSWVLAPRLNAAGRMDHANISYELLVTESEETAKALAATLERHNRERQRLTEEALNKARSILQLGPLIMVGDPSFTPGIIGLVAGRLVEEFTRPAIVVSLGQEESRGSCRSIPEFDIGSALHRAATRITGGMRCGGHPQAAGFTIATEKLPSLQHHLVALAQESLGERAPQASLDIDLALPLGSLPRDIYPTIKVLAPFGNGNPAPVFLSRKVQVSEARPFGTNGAHLKLKLKDMGVTWEAVAFGQKDRFPAGVRYLDVVYSLEVDRWGATEALRLNVLDLRAAAG